jgi:hypothetical protein
VGKSQNPDFITAYNHSMKKIPLLLLIILSLTGAAQETFNYQKDFKTMLAKTKDPNDSLYYENLLSRYYMNDTTLSNYEVLALLIGYTDNPAYKPHTDLVKEKEIHSLNLRGEYAKALVEANSFLPSHPFSVKAIFAKAYAFNNLEKEDSAAFYAFRGFSIFHAMELTGDGRSSETPFFSLGAEDGQDYIRRAVGVGVGKKGMGQDRNGNALNIVEARAENGNSMLLYFIIQHTMDKQNAETIGKNHKN